MTIMKYSVQGLINETYQVIDIDEYSDNCNNVIYQGSLADCEAYIRLKEEGYM